jgi:organic hydroperoxide reductase OsmC/OhrA
MQVTVALSNVAGTEAALGRAGGHTLVVDRPDGRAGGLGLGFNGAELLALAIGGCLCNDLRYVAHAMEVALDRVAVTVDLEMAGDPLIATGAQVTIACDTADGSDPGPVIERARTITMVGNSLARGVPVAFGPGATA